jgi:rubrerythrin
MSLYDLAVKMELDGEQYYLELANNATHPGIKAVFELMAADERKHYEIVSNIIAGGVRFKEGTSLETLKSVFAKALESGETLEMPDHAFEAYRKAADMERKSIDFYKDAYERTHSDHEKKILLELQEEENRHLMMCENLAEYVQRPLEWVESAEFNHLMDY